MTTPAIPILVERWKRYGHDRAYVKIDGRQLGHRDLKSGQVYCADPADRDTIVAATDHLLASMVAADAEFASAYVGRHAAADCLPAPPQAHLTIPSAPVLLPDRDLSLNRAGQAARERAVMERQAAPVRTLIARIAGVKTDERAWRIGADAEHDVGRRLSSLGTGWQTLHALPIGDQGSDIDHLVIGPAGVFTLNTKHHPGANVWVGGDTIKVNGHNQPYVRNSRSELKRAAKLLTARTGFDVEVRALIVVMGASGGFTVKEQPGDGQVVVVIGKKVANYLRSLPPVLGVPSIDRIYGVARHLATWQPKTVAWSDF